MTIKKINIPIFVFFTIYAKCLFTLLHSLLLNICDIFRGIWFSLRSCPPLSKLSSRRWDGHITWLSWDDDYEIPLIAWDTWDIWPHTVDMTTYLWQWLDVHEPSMMLCFLIMIHWLACLLVCDVYPCGDSLNYWRTARWWPTWPIWIDLHPFVDLNRPT